MRSLRLFALALVTALLWSPAQAADTEQQLRELKSKIDALQQRLQRQRGQRSDTEAALRDIETRIGSTLNDIRSTEAALQQQGEQLQQLQQQRRQLQQQLQGQQALIERHVLEAYRLGRQKKLKVLLNQEAPDQLNRTLTYFDYFNRARAEQIESYLGTIAELDAVTPAINAKREQLQQTRAELAQRQQALGQQRAERERSLAALDADIGSGTAKLESYGREQKELEQLLRALQEELANLAPPGDHRPFKAMRGKLAWPASGKHRNRFGAPRGGNSELRWQGVNIAAAAGSEVRAIHHGRVVFADWLRGAGLLIIIDHGDGYMSLYGHNQSLLRATGDWVNTGESIATVGDSGGQQSAGLYFEIRRNGRPTDPRRWCRG